MAGLSPSHQPLVRRGLEDGSDPTLWPGGIVTAWKDGWRRHTLRGLHYTDADPGRPRLSRGHRTLGKRRWHETIRKVVTTETRDEVPWQIVAVNR